MTTTIVDEFRTLDATEKFDLDFEDAQNYYAVRKCPLEGITSFDKYFKEDWNRSIY